uniref:Uncharacterized protein n=1 Tax=Octopus bimaculoides TaxID=37653 RepID=A0A0L8GXP4_OCTBM
MVNVNISGGGKSANIFFLLSFFRLAIFVLTRLPVLQQNFTGIGLAHLTRIHHLSRNSINT